MKDKKSADKDDQMKSGWDEGIRALINGNVHHEMGGTRLHEEQFDSTMEVKRGSAKRPSGKQRAKRPSRGSTEEQQRRHRRAS